MADWHWFYKRSSDDRFIYSPTKGLKRWSEFSSLHHEDMWERLAEKGWNDITAMGFITDRYIIITMNESGLDDEELEEEIAKALE